MATSSHPPFAFEEVKALLSRAMDLPEAEREQAVLSATAGNRALRDEVLELLSTSAGVGQFLSGPRPVPAIPVPGDLEQADRDWLAPQPESIGGLRVLKILGFGGMGVVYLAEQNHPRRLVAVKVLNRAPGKPSTAERFRREIDILARLKHPGIAEIYDAGGHGDSDGPNWYSMEYIEGLTLGEYFRSRERSPEAIARVVHEIAAIVAYAHRFGILHRDLKPENILIDAEGCPHVLDFGVARLIERDSVPFGPNTVSGTVVGTLEYMSPEQARGGQLDFRSDVFSLGAILYELLAGRQPYESAEPGIEAYLRAKTSTEAEPLAKHAPDLAGDLAIVVQKAVARDPVERYLDMSEFADDLGRWLRHRPVAARPPSLWRRARKWLRRNRVLGVTLLAVFGLLSTALVYVDSLRRKAERAQEESRLAIDDVVRFSNGFRIDELIKRGDELWPAGPEQLEALEDLLVEGRRVAGRLGEEAGRLEQRSRERSQGRLQARYAGILDGGFMLSMQEALVRRLEQLVVSTIPELERRLRWARWSASSVARYRPIWARVTREIERAPAYRGMRIEPRPGLIPLGADPHSGMHEFAFYLPDSVVPRRDPSSGELILAERACPVFVLLPGGPTGIGSQDRDPRNDYFVEGRFDHWLPVTEVVLDPFWISKYEITQHQWLMTLGSNPSYWSPGKVVEGRTIQLRNPVGALSWIDAAEFTRRLGLVLPTEAQWEYAARGGSKTAFWWGPSPEEMWLRANLLRKSPGIDDGYRVHAPVGTLAPNPFGLHEVLGNMEEPCLDAYKVRPWVHGLRTGDGLVLAGGDGGRSVRGGGYDTTFAMQVPYRYDVQQDAARRTLGVRPVLPLTPGRGR